jgi:GNAT superfamily N-acetyltransferase
MSAEFQSVCMVRQTAEPYPSYPLPAGFSVSWYERGGEDCWFDIQRQADPSNPITRATFSQYFGGAATELSRRQCYLLDAAGQPVGTATAWFEQNYHGQEWGRLHWVAILPQHQGRGLGRPLLSVVCERMKSLHPERAFLRTASHRLAAIHLYLEFGFVPEIRNPGETAVWKRIIDQLPKRR